MEPITASRLRADIYRILDQVLETGVPVEIERRGRILRIEADEPVSKLDRVVPDPDLIVNDPDDLVGLEWSSDWKPHMATDPESR